MILTAESVYTMTRTVFPLMRASALISRNDVALCDMYVVVTLSVFRS
jgi:hypothetical protein